MSTFSPSTHIDLHDEAVSVGSEQVVYMLRVLQADRRALYAQVDDWLAELGLSSSDGPDEWSPDGVALWFAQIWLTRMASEEP